MASERNPWRAQRWIVDAVVAVVVGVARVYHGMLDRPLSSAVITRLEGNRGDRIAIKFMQQRPHKMNRWERDSPVSGGSDLRSSHARAKRLAGSAGVEQTLKWL